MGGEFVVAEWAASGRRVVNRMHRQLGPALISLRFRTSAFPHQHVSALVRFSARVRASTDFPRRHRQAASTRRALLLQSISLEETARLLLYNFAIPTEMKVLLLLLGGSPLGSLI